MKRYSLILFSIMATLLIECSAPHKDQNKGNEFKFQTEQFGDIRILRYQVPGFEQLTLKQKELCYYLEQAGYCGREIFYDQNCRANLSVKRTIELIVENYKGDRESENFKKFIEYTKRVWFSNGIHHHYSMDKIIPEFPVEYLDELIKNSADIKLPLGDGETADYFIDKMKTVIFSHDFFAKRLNQDAHVDMVKTSANNYYEEMSQKEVTDFYSKLKVTGDPQPLSFGLNSKLLKKDGQFLERIYKVGGMYSAAIEKIIFWLTKATSVAESDQQKKIIEKLIEYYQTGDLQTWDEYSILWVKDTTSVVDFTNGFIEVYGDPMGIKGAWQSVVYIKDMEMTNKLAAISNEAAWFEKNSTIADEYKKENPKGITYKVVDVVAEAGDCSPSTPIGVNLPNADWIRTMYGSKSVSLGNIEHAYDEANKTSGILEEFHTPEQVKLIKEFGELGGKLHTGLHEVIGHGSGKLKTGVDVPHHTLKNYASTIEEARADLVALYFIIDKHLVDCKLTSSIEVGKAEYDAYIVNALLKQLARIKDGSNVEESHMRNRQMIAKWCFEKGKPANVIEQKVIDGKTYFVVNDYNALRKLFGELLKEIQRIKSEGDYNAARDLVENFGVKVDQQLHKEVLERYKHLNIAPFAGFINPVLVPKIQGDKIVDIKLDYPDDFMKQMLWYAKEYRILPTYN